MPHPQALISGLSPIPMNFFYPAPRNPTRSLPYSSNRYLAAPKFVHGFLRRLLYTAAK
jgi:hypothetical protein